MGRRVLALGLAEGCRFSVELSVCGKEFCFLPGGRAGEDRLGGAIMAGRGGAVGEQVTRAREVGGGGGKGPRVLYPPPPPPYPQRPGETAGAASACSWPPRLGPPFLASAKLCFPVFRSGLVLVCPGHPAAGVHLTSHRTAISITLTCRTTFTLWSGRTISVTIRTTLSSISIAIRKSFFSATEITVSSVISTTIVTA